MNRKINLNGKWFYKTDKDTILNYESVHEMFLAGKINDKMDIPNNWQLAGLHNFNGAVWFIKKYSVENYPFVVKYSVIDFKGIDYFSDVWLNGKFIGRHEGYFQSFSYDVSRFIQKENLLIVKVTSPFEEPGSVWPLKKKLIKGIFNHHDCRPGGWDYERGQDQNTGGIWNDVQLSITDHLFIDYTKVSSKINYDKNTALIKIDCRYKSNLKKSLKDTLKIEITSPSKIKQRNIFEIILNPKRNYFTLSIEIYNPELWWCWDLGKPNLYDLKISGSIFGVYQTKFGIREVKLDDKQIFYLNKKRLFLRGTNIIPTQFLSDLSVEKISKQVSLILEANLNIVRMHAHVNRKDYYDECDRQGILVWQDFPLQWTYDDSNEFAENAVGQIKEMVNQNYNHPSIAIWCCHNEPGTQIETLDRRLKKAVSSQDKTRIIRIASNYEEHAYDGWYWGDKEHYAATPMGPLVTEFGAQALPHLLSLKKFLSNDDLEKPNWDIWKYHNFQYEQTFQIAGVEKGKSINEFINNSQEYQADLIRTAIDFYRRKRFNGINGIFQFMLIDCWPSVTWSVVDYYFKKKKGYDALKRVMQPLYASVRVRQKKYFPGKKMLIDLWIINDLHRSYPDCSLIFMLGGKSIHEIKLGKIEADSIRFIDYESLNIELPIKSKTGKHKIDLTLVTNKQIRTVNEFLIEIERPFK